MNLQGWANDAWADGAWLESAWGGGVAPSAPVLLDQIPNLSAQYDSGTHQFDLSEYFSGATSYAIDPAVEEGWSFDTNTGILEIDTDVEDTFGPYTVTATNDEGSTDSNAFTVKVSVSTASIYQGPEGGLLSGFSIRF